MTTASTGRTPDKHPTSPTDTSIPLYNAVLLIWCASAAIIAGGVIRELLAFASGMPSQDFSLKLLRLDDEATIPTWYSSMQLLLCSVLLFLEAWHAIAARSKQWMGWLVLAIGFMFMSVDEIATIHETIGSKLKDALHTTGFFAFGWVLVALPVLVIVAVLLARFIVRLPGASRALFLASGAVYVLGAVGLEMLGGPVFEAGGVNAPQYVAIVVLEETLEIVGVSLFLTALLLLHAHRERQGWLLRMR